MNKGMFPVYPHWPASRKAPDNSRSALAMQDVGTIGLDRPTRESMLGVMKTRWGRGRRTALGCTPRAGAIGLRGSSVKPRVGVTLHDGNGRVSVVSSEAARLLGVDQAELVGKVSLFDSAAVV